MKQGRLAKFSFSLAKALVGLGAVVFSIAQGCGQPLPEDLNPKASRPEMELRVLRPIKLTPQARLPEQDPRLRAVEVGPDSIVFAYDGEPFIRLEPGHVIAGEQGENGYLRRVIDVEKLGGGRILVRTEEAALDELIEDGAFEFSVPLEVADVFDPTLPSDGAS
ncbi:MAG: hypothetical protein N2515_04445, partial [Deltaproteobacteria bacterium]|nr:hypothetical protein [Deltaproteobacteria bacterium]